MTGRMERIIVCALTLVAGSLAAEPALSQSDREAPFYELVTYEPPADLKLEISGMAMMPDGRLAVALRKGEIWLIENPTDPGRATYRQFATGLHEPLGLAYRQGVFYTVQRTELTSIRDFDQDDVADEYLTVAKGWGVSGSYHEYAYGPVFDPAGNAWITLNCAIGKGPNPADNAWRGWSMKVSPEGRMTPVSGGFRSPSGIGINLAGDLFATDQQGNWFPTCPLLHVQEGAFHGHGDALKFCDLPGATFKIDGKLPENLTVVQAAKKIAPYKLPAVWFPYRKVGMSATDILCDTTEGKFGPFAGQLFVGEFTMSFVSRVFLEKVKGQYQGACFRFREGLQCAALRMAWGPDGSMFVGQSNRGWNSLGTRAYGMQRLVWSGKTPFEIKSMEALTDGFRLTFTQALDRDRAGRPESYAFASYTYPYHSKYGGEEIDVKKPPVKSATVAEDGLSVILKMGSLRAGYVHELDATRLLSRSGDTLLHPEAYYTLNQLP
jgi:hypothetical protein